MQAIEVQGSQNNVFSLPQKFKDIYLYERFSATLNEVASRNQQITRENPLSSDSSLSQDEDDQFSQAWPKSLEDNPFIVEKSYLEENDLNPCLPEKTNDEARINYINRLVNMKIMSLKPKKKFQNCFVFDWDDTLFCTSSFEKISLTNIPCEMRPRLHILDTTASQLLLKASKCGEVYIITNSDKGWIEQSARETLPKTYQIMSRNSVQIISARKDYGHLYPNDMYRWKLEAFLSLRKQFDLDIITNLVVVGDSDLEMQAAKTLSKKFKQAIVKTIKLKSCPKIDELIKQQQIITELFEEIFMGYKNMTVRLGNGKKF